MTRTIQVCIVGILAFLCIVVWKSNSGITSIRQAHPAQAIDQSSQHDKMPDSAKTKDSDSKLLQLNLGSLPNPPAPDPPQRRNRARVLID